MTDADWVKQERDHEYSMADLKMKDQWRKREAWNVRIGYIATAVAAVLITAIVIIPIYLYNVSSGKTSKEIQIACATSGGTWTSLGGGSNMCVYFDKAGNEKIN
jgi:hypothetical protein